MLTRIHKVVFNEDLHPHFHRCMENAVHRGAEDHQVAHMGGRHEIQMIDCSGHYVIARMTMRRHGAGHINPVHQSSAEQGPKRVGVVRQNNLGHLRLRITDGPRHHQVIISFHKLALAVSSGWTD